MNELRSCAKVSKHFLVFLQWFQMTMLKESFPFIIIADQVNPLHLSPAKWTWTYIGWALISKYNQNYPSPPPGSPAGLKVRKYDGQTKQTNINKFFEVQPLFQSIFRWSPSVIPDAFLDNLQPWQDIKSSLLLIMLRLSLL